MTLGELLEELREGILHDFSDQIAGSSDYLWSDKRLVRYIDEAQRRMAREALLIRDGTTPQVTHIQTRAGTKHYPLDPSVLAVISAKCGANSTLSIPADTADLVRAGHASFNTYHVPDTYFFDPGSLSTLPPGKMMAYDTDEFVGEDEFGSMGAMNLRVYPAPDAAHVQPLHLRVVRLPLNRLTLDNPDAVPEIPEIHHVDMLEWAAYLALRIVDLDQGMPDRANEFRQSFEAHCKEARNIFMRKMFASNQWGFGRNGFSWEQN